MYSGELEVQAKRKAIAVLQDEINRILNAARELSSLPELLVKKNKTDVKAKLEQISSLEDEVENLRRKITRDVADVGGLIMNRENILNTAYTMDEIAGYITGIAFKLSNIKVKTLTTENFQIELVINDNARNLNLRIIKEIKEDLISGYVVTIDDMTSFSFMS